MKPIVFAEHINHTIASNRTVQLTSILTFKLNYIKSQLLNHAADKREKLRHSKMAKKLNGNGINETR